MCRAPSASAKLRAAFIRDEIGMYAYRGLSRPERSTPAMPSIAWTPSSGFPVKSIESCQRTALPSGVIFRACCSQGPSRGSLAANGGAFVGVTETWKPAISSLVSRAIATRSGCSSKKRRVNANQPGSSRPSSMPDTVSRSPARTSSIRWWIDPSHE
jgi:hypothetical protein